MMKLLASVGKKLSALASAVGGNPLTARSALTAAPIRKLSLSIQAGIFWLYHYLSDQFNVSDTRTTQFNKNSADNIQFGDATKTFVIGKGAAETVNFTEAVARGITKPLTPDDVGITDTEAIGYSANDADQVQFGDAEVTQIGKNVVDVLNVTDDLDGAATLEDEQVAFVGKSASDQANFSDQLVRTAQFVRGFLDQTNFAEQATIGYAAADSDSFNVTDQATTTTQFARQPTDQTNFSDQAITTTQFVRQPADQANFADTEVVSYSAVDSDSFNVADQALTSTQFARQPTDQTNFTDQALTATQFVRGFADQTNFADTEVVSYAAVDLDSFNISDQPASTIQKPLLDAFKVTDDLDGVATLEDEQTAAFFKVAAETVNFGDTEVYSLQKAVADQTNIDDSGLVSVQSYTDPTYFSADYVGDSRTF